ncbi:unnamed protein product [Thlaspi arvense]|uniref:TFIIS N-terminal domain-containing protein n=1 Tax=Thlaspi arvense TaxID=13288 RepID=A0AAU9SQY3_THLAR|nr:unnamed protein product [Thlaspi arvense]
MIATDLISAAIKATCNTQSPGGVERCVDVLNQLNSLSLSATDIRQLSVPIFKLETLRRHRNPKIRKESQSLFDSWLITLYAQGRDQSLKSGLTQIRLKPRNLACSSELNKKKKKEKEQSSLMTLEPEKIKKTGFLETKKRQDSKASNTNLLETKRKRDIKDKDGKVTTKALIPPPRRHVYTTKESGNPRSEALKRTTEEMVELFESAKKAADVANAKGILLGKAEASRCVDALSLLMKINFIPKPKEPMRMMERLERLTKHKDLKICSAASALLRLWRQRVREQERKDSIGFKRF